MCTRASGTVVKEKRQAGSESGTGLVYGFAERDYSAFPFDPRTLMILCM